MALSALVPPGSALVPPGSIRSAEVSKGQAGILPDLGGGGDSDGAVHLFAAGARGNGCLPPDPGDWGILVLTADGAETCLLTAAACAGKACLTASD